MNPYIFVCAGEDSGDILGEHVIRVLQESGIKTRGIGGPRMARAGLSSIEGFEKFPVSGFWNVIKKIPFFFLFLKKAKKEILNPNCLAFVAIDYPGLNLKLVKWAKKYGKPVYYLSPPQIFAWKKNRAKILKNTYSCVFFPFEQEAYESKGVPVNLVEHPFYKTAKELSLPEKKEFVFFLPGSRRHVLLRNLPIYIKAAKRFSGLGEPVFVASRKTLYDLLKQNLPSEFTVKLMPENPEEKASFLSRAKIVIGNPGTALLESSLCETPVASFTYPDVVTYLLGKAFLKIPYLTLPNLLLKEKFYPEIIISPFKNPLAKVDNLYEQVSALLKQPENNAFVRQRLLQKMEGNGSVQGSVAEFLLKFLKGKSQ